MKILAVDDDPIHLDILRLALKKLKYRTVQTANSAVEALEKISGAHDPFDCILLDVVMPEVDGVELCGEIRQMPQYQSTPIFMITRLSEKSSMDQAFARGATDFVTKPFDPIELHARLRLAENLSRQDRNAKALGAEIAGLRSELANQGQIDIDAPLAMDDVVGAIDYLALQNYLLRVARTMFKLQLFAVKISNISEIFDQTSPSEFRHSISRAGDAIAASLKTRQYFFSYAGDGLFPVVLADGMDMEREFISLILQRECLQNETVLVSGRVVRLQLAVGLPVRMSPFSRSPGTRALRQAMLQAEVASANRKAGQSRSVAGASGVISQVSNFFAA